MEKKTARRIKWAFIISSAFALLIFSLAFFITFSLSKTQIISESEYNREDNCLYHVVITGTYENQSFLTEVYKGASKLAKSSNAIIELNVPQSQADTTSLQDLLDYCTYLNVDGIIAYIDSTEETPTLLQRKDDPKIPLVTIGQFAPNIPQISYIGTNGWELGKKIADETVRLIDSDPYIFNRSQVSICIICNSTSTNSSNLLNSLKIAIQEQIPVQPEIIDRLTPQYQFTKQETYFICLTEEETIVTAQLLSEQFPDRNFKFIGFGGNEVCQLYLQKGYITELFSLDPEKIGETAIHELFEYRHKGYANSYVTADVKISGVEK